MEIKKLREVVENMVERIDIELGINPMTNQEGIKINGLPTEYDIEFIENNRDEVIKILREIQIEKNIEKIAVTVNIPEELFQKLRKEAIDKELTVEKLILSKIED